MSDAPIVTPLPLNTVLTVESEQVYLLPYPVDGETTVMLPPGVYSITYDEQSDKKLSILRVE